MSSERQWWYQILAGGLGAALGALVAAFSPLSIWLAVPVSALAVMFIYDPVRFIQALVTAFVLTVVSTGCSIHWCWRFKKDIGLAFMAGMNLVLWVAILIMPLVRSETANPLASMVHGLLPTPLIILAFSIWFVWIAINNPNEENSLEKFSHYCRKFLICANPFITFFYWLPKLVIWAVPRTVKFLRLYVRNFLLLVYRDAMLCAIIGAVMGTLLGFVVHRVMGISAWDKIAAIGFSAGAISTTLIRFALVTSRSDSLARARR